MRPRILSALLVGLLTLTLGPASASAELTSSQIDNLWTYAIAQLSATDAAIASNRVPEKTYGASWTIKYSSSWISGFFPGCLWQVARHTGDAAWLNRAIARTQTSYGQEYNDADHDVGFRCFNSFGEGYRTLADGSRRDNYRSRLLIAATTLAGRYNSAYQAIESWDGDRVIIDNMMNLELLMWASENGASDAAWLRQVALNHAQTTINEIIRPDGSTYHVVEFYPNGMVESKYTHQGFANWSTWSRGQAWGLYGFTALYRYTDDALHLTTACRLADYFVDHLPADGVPPYDFDAPDQTLLDSSAGAIAASGLLELSTYVPEVQSIAYREAAEKILEGLAAPAILTEGTGFPSILREGSVRTGDHHLGLIYGDYYFLEALTRYEEIPPVLPGDANGDGTVNVTDFIALKQNYNTTSGASWAMGDFTGDGAVDVYDFVILKQNYNTTIH